MSGEAQAHRDLVVRHVVVRGRVQGVGFRAWTEVAALERGLEGWAGWRAALFEYRHRLSAEEGGVHGAQGGDAEIALDAPRALRT